MTIPAMGNSRRRRAVQALAAVVIAAAAVLAVVLLTSAQGRVGPRLEFTVFSNAVARPDGAVWTGRRFLFVENTANVIWAVSPAGSSGGRFGAMPRVHEEARCVLSPGAHGFPRGAVFCHSPDHRIWEFSAAGRRRLFAVLRGSGLTADDGAIAFDGAGRYGFAMLAATGRSGAGHPPGGALYAVDARGRARRLGNYTGPGGADQLIVAPSRFGSARAEALLTVDAGAADGRLVAVAPDGGERTLTTFPDGPNPIVTLGDGLGTGPSARLFLTDDETHHVDVASAAPLRQFSGDVLVGSEIHGLFWVVRPSGSGFETVPVETNLDHASTHSLEAMILAP